MNEKIALNYNDLYFDDSLTCRLLYSNYQREMFEARKKMERLEKFDRLFIRALQDKREITIEDFDRCMSLLHHSNQIPEEIIKTTLGEK